MKKIVVEIELKEGSKPDFVYDSVKVDGKEVVGACDEVEERYAVIELKDSFIEVRRYLKPEFVGK